MRDPDFLDGVVLSKTETANGRESIFIILVRSTGTSTSMLSQVRLSRRSVCIHRITEKNVLLSLSLLASPLSPSDFVFALGVDCGHELMVEVEWE